MKFTRVAFSFLSVCVLLAGTAFAQTIYYVGDESQKNGDDAAQKNGRDACQKDGKDACQKDGDCCAPCCPFELFPKTCRGIKVGGWFQTGYHTQGANEGFAGHTGGVFRNVPTLAMKRPFNSDPNFVQLHQAWIYAEKVAETCGCGTDWGFRVDYVYGTDGQDAQATGNVPGIWDEPWDNGNYGSAMPQVYSELAYNDVSVKMGHFFTMIGYEKVQAPENFFYSHSMSKFIEPYGHTGVLADYDVNCRLTVFGGWTAGWDTGFDQNGGDSYLSGVAFQVNDSMSLTYAAMYGDFGYATDFGSDSDGYIHSIVLDWDVSCRLNYVLQTDYLDNEQLTNNNGPFFSVNQYLIYTLNDCWALGGRFEYMNEANNGGGANAGNTEYQAVTVGANYRPHANVVIRPEVRVDVMNDFPGMQDSTVFGIDAIVTF